jgi:hypothetical protein
MWDYPAFFSRKAWKAATISLCYLDMLCVSGTRARRPRDQRAAAVRKIWDVVGDL